MVHEADDRMPPGVPLTGDAAASLHLQSIPALLMLAAECMRRRDRATAGRCYRQVIARYVHPPQSIMALARMSGAADDPGNPP